MFNNIPFENEEKWILVLETTDKNGLDLDIKKIVSVFSKLKIEFLEYVIGNGTIKAAPSKTTSVQNFPIPNTVERVQSFLVLTGFFF